MNIYLFLAASLTVILGIVHSVLGEMKVLSKLKSEFLPKMQGIPLLWKNENAAKLTIRMVWHVTTVLAFGIAVILFYFALVPYFMVGIHHLVVLVIAGAMFLCSIVSLILTKGSHMAWLIFLVIGILCLAGL